MNDKKIHKYINIDDLYKVGDRISFKKSVGKNVYFEYKDLKGYIKIVSYLNKKIKIKYENNETWILISNFKNANLGGLFKHYVQYKFEINDKIKDKKRDIVIIDRKVDTNNGKNLKYYKYHCNKCGYEGWMLYYSLENGNNCKCCAKQVIVKGINDIATTHPWMMEYIANINDCYKYSSRSGVKIEMKCPQCGNLRFMWLGDLYNNGFSCNKCGDGFSYPNKFIVNILDQIEIKYECEYSPKWLNRKRFDVFIPSLNLIIEMDGDWHKKNNNLSGQTKEESKERDNWKDKQAKLHGLDVVRIDCGYKNMHKFDHIKNSILNSKLIKYFDFKDIDWKEVNKYANDSLVKYVCEYYNQHKLEMFKSDIAKNLNISRATLSSYLKIGNNIGYCHYDVGESNKNRFKVKKLNAKPIRVIETGDEFESMRECQKKSKEMYGVILWTNGIRNVLNGTIKKYRGYTFEVA